MTIIEQIKAEIERRIALYSSLSENTVNPNRIDEDRQILRFLSTLEESERPEPYNPVYDEAYLNEKIKKATESWRGVDVDAMLAECRGYDEEKSEKPMQEGLEEEIDKLYLPNRIVGYQDGVGEIRLGREAFGRIARHFAQWGAEHLADARKTSPKDLEEAAREYAHCPYTDENGNFHENAINASTYWNFIDGAKWQKEQMMKDGLDAVKSGQSNKIEKTIAGVFVKYGMDRQKEQMLKDAVEYEVWDFSSSLEAYPHVNIPLDNKQYRSGDKVRVIVLKKED